MKIYVVKLNTIQPEIGKCNLLPKLKHRRFTTVCGMLYVCKYYVYETKYVYGVICDMPQVNFVWVAKRDEKAI